MMEDITNNNCEGMCVEKTCNEKHTKMTHQVIQGIKLILTFCERHSEQFENKGKNPILGYEGEFPVMLCVPRTDIDFGMKFYCKPCRQDHRHGDGEGHRVAHCDDYFEASPYKDTGYIITLDENYLTKKESGK